MATYTEAYRNARTRLAQREKMLTTLPPGPYPLRVTLEDEIEWLRAQIVKLEAAEAAQTRQVDAAAKRIARVQKGEERHNNERRLWHQRFFKEHGRWDHGASRYVSITPRLETVLRSEAKRENGY